MYNGMRYDECNEMNENVAHTAWDAKTNHPYGTKFSTVVARRATGGSTRRTTLQRKRGVLVLGDRS